MTCVYQGNQLDAMINNQHENLRSLSEKNNSYNFSISDKSISANYHERVPDLTIVGDYCSHHRLAARASRAAASAVTCNRGDGENPGEIMVKSW